MESYLSDGSMEPSQLIAGFWKLLRVLEVWWLLQQAVPSLPRHFASQIVGSLLRYFDAVVNKPTDEVDGEDRGVSSPITRLYETRLRITMYLPLYSAEVQEFVASIVNGFDPARYVAAAMTELALASSKCRLIQFTKTPAQVDSHFASEDDEHIHDNLVIGDDAATGDVSAAEDNYTVFEARLF
ncbi:hypothetical protein FBU31_007325 [Coemansia sp. 'formosensis']|nr:hypothetical protein FBU31_007325 [Coemansia sp. 'formosensis']